MELLGILSLFTTVQGRVTESGKGEVWIKASAQSEEFCKGMEQRTEHTRDSEGSEAAGSGMLTAPPPTLSSRQVVWILLASDLDFHCLDFKSSAGNQKHWFLDLGTTASITQCTPKTR